MASFNANPGQVAGDEDAQFQQFLRTEISKAVAEAGIQKNPDGTVVQQQAQPAAGPVTIQLDGKPFQFNSLAEANAAIQQSFDSQRQQMAQLQAQLAQNKPAKGGKATGDDDVDDSKPEFEFQTYVDKMAKDPLDAADYMDRARFGFNPVKKLKKLSRIVEEKAAIIDNQERVLAAYQFKDNHPEYVGSPQSAYVLDQVMKNMNLPFNAEGLESAYAVAVQRGWIRNEAPQQQQQQDQPSLYSAQNAPTFGQPDNPYQQGPSANQWQGYQPPPRVSRQAQDIAPDITQQFENMSLEQMEGVLQKLGVK